MAVENGYKVREIHEIYEYRLTHFNTQTDEGGLIVNYINTLLKLKAEASGYPGWVPSAADLERYIESFWKSEGIRLDKGLSNPTLRNGVWLNCASIPCGVN